MGNQPSTPASASSASNRRKSKSKNSNAAAETADKAKKMVQDVQTQLNSTMRKLEDSSLIDTVCGPFFESEQDKRYGAAYSEDLSEDSRTISEDDHTDDGYQRRRKSKATTTSTTKKGDSGSVISDFPDQDSRAADTASRQSFESENSKLLIQQPLASSFAKRCYFTKAGIGKTTQHYEGLTLTGNIVLMLATAMKLKGCPTICDEDLRRVEQTYPNQFSRLPDELLLSSGWRRISKYCHFSNKPIPDGVPFFRE